MHPTELKTLFDQLSAALVLYARQWCEMPDDAVQEAFIDLANAQEEPKCSKSWLYTTTRRKAQNIARAERRRRGYQRQAAEQRSFREEQKDWFRPTASTQLVAEDVAHGLAALNGDERQLLVARVWGGLNFEQLAELLECSVSSAHRRYAAALERLKAILTTGVETVHPSTPKRVSQENVNMHPNVRRPSKTDLDRVDSRARLADGEVS